MDLFAYPTISKLAEFLEMKTKEVDNKDIEITPLILPKDYFSSGDSKNTRSVLKFNIKDDLYKVIKEIAFKEEIELSDFLIGMYMYLFVQLTEQKKISVQMKVSNTDDLLSINVDFANTTDFSNLFSLVNQQRRENHSLYNMQQIDPMILK